LEGKTKLLGDRDHRTVDCTLVLSPQQGYVADLQFARKGQLALNHSLVMTKSAVEIYAWDTSTKLNLGAAIFPTLNLEQTAERIEDGRYKNRLKIGAGLYSAATEPADREPLFSAHVEPVTLVNLLHRTSASYVVDGSELRVTEQGLELYIDTASGRINRIVLRNVETSEVVATLTFQSNAFTSKLAEVRRRGRDLQERFDQQRPVYSALDFALGEAMQQPLVEKSAGYGVAGQRLREILAATSPETIVTDLGWSDLLEGVASSDDVEVDGLKFTIPADTPNAGGGWQAELVRVMPFLADRLFPRGSWPWIYTREIAFNLADNHYSPDLSAGQGGELQAVFMSDDTGILGMLVAAIICENRLPNAAVQFLIGRANATFTDESYIRDVGVFVRGEHGAAKSISLLVGYMESLTAEEQDELLKILPPLWAETVEALIARRKARPAEAVADSIEIVLLDHWRRGWRAATETRFERIGRKAQSTTEKDAETVTK
jgi:hypothetical protein